MGGSPPTVPDSLTGKPLVEDNLDKLEDGLELLRKKHINKVLQVPNGQHPILLKQYLAKNISLETLCIMDDIIDMCDTEWKNLISEQLVYPEVHRLVKKYKTFLTYDYAKFRETLIGLC